MPRQIIKASLSASALVSLLLRIFQKAETGEGIRTWILRRELSHGETARGQLNDTVHNLLFRAKMNRARVTSRRLSASDWRGVSTSATVGDMLGIKGYVSHFRNPKSSFLFTKEG